MSALLSHFQAPASAPAPPRRVCALDAQPIVAEGIARAIEASTDFEFAGCCSHPGDALDLARAQQPDLFLLDPGAGTRNVLDLLAQLPRVAPQTRFLLWDRNLTAADRRVALELGVVRPLDRSLEVTDLLKALRAELAPSPAGGPPVSAQWRAAQRLTSRERDIIRLVAGGLKNREIGEQLLITPGTVKVHLMHIFEKTGIRDRVELGRHSAGLLGCASEEENDR